MWSQLRASRLGVWLTWLVSRPGWLAYAVLRSGPVRRTFYRVNSTTIGWSGLASFLRSQRADVRAGTLTALPAGERERVGPVRFFAARVGVVLALGYILGALVSGALVPLAVSGVLAAVLVRAACRRVRRGLGAVRSANAGPGGDGYFVHLTDLGTRGVAGPARRRRARLRARRGAAGGAARVESAPMTPAGPA